MYSSKFELGVEPGGGVLYNLEWIFMAFNEDRLQLW